MSATIRQQIVRLLEIQSLGARDLAEYLALTPREVEGHLTHISRSLKKRLQMEPAKCRQCGYVFKGRSRLDSPGRCPKCKAQRVDGPWFRVIKS